MTKVFIDGSAGTTGLRIQERLAARADIELIPIPDALRKDTAARKERMNNADIVFLCLPDAAAIEAVSLIENSHTVVIDASTAHRTNASWTYGFAEVTGHESIRASKRIANPGCHASGFIALVAPLVKAGALAPDASLCVFSLTGYSGGGKSMIAQYETAERDALLEAPRAYGLSQAHKHLPEMQKVCGLAAAPVFTPIVGAYYAGMEVCVPVTAAQLNCTKEQLEELYAQTYAQGLVRFCKSSDAEEAGFLSAGAYSGFDDMEVTVTGNDERMLLVARFDNLGKGASGSAIQNMNIVLGLNEGEGLNLHAWDK